ncbi:cupin domain-containing protein [Natrinema gelatinilyticum]|uniref:cupin domain-containing protein n=1 Tax=Natrinema gelatinilyticum TaxID=2961571 RepID=UPI0020C279FD|nr:cupin domain-containing protein [Natrinema gelatinilyticum]
MEYEVKQIADIPVMDLSETDMPAEHDIRNLDGELGTNEIRAKLWYFDPGEEIQPHAHAEQEELYYVLDGEFEITLGGPGDPETVTVAPEAIYAAGPGIGHGHRYLGDERGVVLAIAAPGVHDPGREPGELDEQ